ncbi:MAG: vWA domain-containing protein, partial [Candidatus Kapaibacterium sp.]
MKNSNKLVDVRVWAAVEISGRTAVTKLGINLHNESGGPLRVVFPVRYSPQGVIADATAIAIPGCLMEGLILNQYNDHYIMDKECAVEVFCVRPGSASVIVESDGDAPGIGVRLKIYSPLEQSGDNLRYVLPLKFTPEYAAEESGSSEFEIIPQEYDFSINCKINEDDFSEIDFEQGNLTFKIDDGKRKFEWDSRIGAESPERFVVNLRAAKPYEAITESDGWKYFLVDAPPAIGDLPFDIQLKEFAIIVDSSASTARYPEINRAAVDILNQIRNVDRFNLIITGGSNRAVFELAEFCNSRNCEAAISALRNTESSGKASMIAAVKMALRAPGRPSCRRYILILTDGLAGDAESLTATLYAETADAVVMVLSPSQ